MQSSDKVALITGGTRGIGKATCARLLADNWTVVSCYLRNRRAAEETEQAFASLPGTFVTVKANVATEDGLATLLQACRDQTSQLNGVVLNAASGVLNPLSEISRKHWDWTMNINAWPIVELVQRVSDLLVPGSSVVGISSPGANRAIPSYGAVGLSKAVLESAMRQFCLEYGDRRVRFNSIRAGLVPTEALNHFRNKDELTEETLARTPLGKLVTPEDVADAVHFLLSDASKMITGATIVVDGGASVLA